MSKPLAAIQLPVTRTTISAHCRRSAMTRDVKSAAMTKTARASPKKKYAPSSKRWMPEPFKYPWKNPCRVASAVVSGKESFAFAAIRLSGKRNEKQVNEDPRGIPTNIPVRPPANQATGRIHSACREDPAPLCPARSVSAMTGIKSSGLKNR